MTKRIGVCLLLALLAALLLLIFLMIGRSDPLEGDGIYFIQEKGGVFMEKRSIERPIAGLFGGGGENVPGDRETRTKQYDTARENRR